MNDGLLGPKLTLGYAHQRLNNHRLKVGGFDCD